MGHFGGIAYYTGRCILGENMYHNVFVPTEKPIHTKHPQLEPCNSAREKPPK